MTQNMNGLDPNNIYPIEGNKHVHFIKPTLSKSNIEVGDYSYYDSKHGELFEEQVL